MEIISDLIKQDPPYESLASVYVNNPKHTSYLLVLASDKAEQYKELYRDVWDYLVLMISFVNDYIRGFYRDVSLKTIFTVLSALIYFVYPKKTFLDSIPGVKLFKQVAFIKAIINSFEEDLIKYKEFKENQEKFLEI